MNHYITAAFFVLFCSFQTNGMQQEKTPQPDLNSVMIYLIQHNKEMRQKVDILVTANVTLSSQLATLTNTLEDLNKHVVKLTGTINQIEKIAQESRSKSVHVSNQLTTLLDGSLTPKKKSQKQKQRSAKPEALPENKE